MFVYMGHIITSDHLKEIDYALSLASKQGLNPSDIHLEEHFHHVYR